MHAPETAVTSSAEKIRGRIPSLAGLRWPAAITVFLYHAVTTPYMFPNLVFNSTIQYVLNASGELGLSFFFVLSGFVLTWSARPRDTATGFWRRRFFKVYPNHWAACALVIALMVGTGYTQELHDVWQSLLLVQSWTPNPLAAVGVNGVTWSLACEVFFYLCFPLLILVLRKIRPNRLWWWVGGVTVAVFLVPVIAGLLPSGPPLQWAPWLSAPRFWFVHFFPVTRMLEFVLGILLARIVITGRAPRIPLRYALLALVVGYVASTLVQRSLYGLVAMNIIPIILLLLAATSADLSGRRWFASTPRMVWFGNITFAFYLLHRIVLEYLPLAFDPFVRHWNLLSGSLLVALAFVVSIGLSWALHAGVERPIYRRFAESRRRRTLATVPVREEVTAAVSGNP